MTSICKIKLNLGWKIKYFEFNLGMYIERLKNMYGVY